MGETKAKQDDTVGVMPACVEPEAQPVSRVRLEGHNCETKENF